MLQNTFTGTLMCAAAEKQQPKRPSLTITWQQGLSTQPNSTIN